MLIRKGRVCKLSLRPRPLRPNAQSPKPAPKSSSMLCSRTAWTPFSAISGASVIPLFDRLYETPIRFVVPVHEQGGCHMADAYARASGKVGVMIATSGPGACNLVTGLATAMMDSIPLVAITGQVRTDLIGDDAFQEAPTTGITRAVTKHSSIVMNVKDLASTIYEAFHIASTGRPGPVLIDIPVDIEFQRYNVNGSIRLNLPGYRPHTNGHAGQIAEAAEAINRSERPVLLAGGGVITANASQELRELARKANLPVAMTLMGLGSFDQRQPQSLDMLGMHGTAYANFAVQECDVLIAVGARFDDRVTGKLATFAPKAKVIHIDIDPSNISKCVEADIPIVGDAKTVLGALAECVEYRERAPWFARIAEWKSRCPPTYDRQATHDQAPVRRSRSCAAGRMRTRSSPPAWGSTKCGVLSSTNSAGRGSLSPRAGWARWVSACPRLSARRSPGPTPRSSISTATTAST